MKYRLKNKCEILTESFNFTNNQKCGVEFIVDNNYKDGGKFDNGMFFHPLSAETIKNGIFTYIPTDNYTEVLDYGHVFTTTNNTSKAISYTSDYGTLYYFTKIYNNIIDKTREIYKYGEDDTVYIPEIKLDVPVET